MSTTSPLRSAILSHLRKASMHGYRLRTLANENAWLYSLKRTSIYSALKGLTEQGLVEHRTELHDGRARKIYTVTEAGRAELEAWLASPPQQELESPDLIAFKISLLDGETAMASRGWLREAHDEICERIRVREAELEAREARSPFADIAIEFGVDQLRLRARLLERALEVADRERPQVEGAQRATG